jgi:hypothetical protein
MKSELEEGWTGIYINGQPARRKAGFLTFSDANTFYEFGGRIDSILRQHDLKTCLTGLLLDLVSNSVSPSTSRIFRVGRFSTSPLHNRAYLNISHTYNKQSHLPHIAIEKISTEHHHHYRIHPPHQKITYRNLHAQSTLSPMNESTPRSQSSVVVSLPHPLFNP